MIRLKLINGVFWCRTDLPNYTIPESAGFVWNNTQRMWWVTDLFVAVKLIEYSVDQQTLDSLQAISNQINSEVDSSLSDQSSGLVSIPVLSGLAYRPFQLAGIEYALRRPHTLIADEMGLGKTIQGAGFLNYTDFRSVLIICPAVVKINWRNELEKWLVEYCPIGVAYGSKPFPTHPIVVINYEILNRFMKEIHSRVWDVLIVDEAHYLKNPEAQRTKNVLGYMDDARKVPGIQAERCLFLTGTPIENKPLELFPILNFMYPKHFPSFFKYAMRYCGAFNDGYSWDFNGASNLDELYTKLRSICMVRRLKRDVLTELPPKVRQIIELPADGNLKLIREERKQLIAYKDQVQKLGYLPLDAEEHLAVIRHKTALAKVPMCLKHITDTVSKIGKVVVFGWHKDVIAALHSGLKVNSVSVTGDTPTQKRQEYVDQFQNDPNCKVFIANFIAGGIGITLTAASLCIAVELPWVPAKLTQAEDRLHRIGQTETVLVQHLVLEGSSDALVAKILIRKQEVSDQALDGAKEETTQLSPSVIADLFNAI